MKRTLLFILIFTLSQDLLAPPNCELYKQDELCYQACEEAWTAIRYPQGSHESQQHFDRSLELCPTFAYSYMEKAVPFLKRGLFIEWKKMIDKAVTLAPKEYLGYRGWCRLQFLRDYQGAIDDIEELKSLVNYDIGFCQTGDYHLEIVRAMCYKELGQLEKARAIYTQHLIEDNYDVDLFDYYHWGVLEFESGNYQKALKHLDKQIEINDDLAGTYFYKALCYKELNEYDLYSENLNKAEAYYQKGKVRTDTYTETLDKVFLIDIQEEIERASKLIPNEDKG